jgi:hypothetical protein
MSIKKDVVVGFTPELERLGSLKNQNFAFLACGRLFYSNKIYGFFAIGFQSIRGET